MRNALAFLHLLTVVFAVGPLVHVTTTAAKSLRASIPERVREASRLTRVYAMASVLPVLFGFGLMSQTGRDGKVLGSFSDTWIWCSTLLWLIAVGIALGIIAPSLNRAADRMDRGEDVSSLRGKVAGAGGAVGLLFAAIVALMVYRP